MFKVYVADKFFVNLKISFSYKDLATIIDFFGNRQIIQLFDFEGRKTFHLYDAIPRMLEVAKKQNNVNDSYSDFTTFELFEDHYPFKLFFLNIPKSHADALMNQYGFAVICPENFENLWKRLTFAGRIDITPDNNIGAINNFNQLNNYIFSRFNFGIIQDPYLITKDNNKASFKFFIKSIFSLQNLKLLLLKEPNKDDTLVQLQNQFNNIIGSIGGIKNQPVLLVKKELGDNDRHCFTNYYYINLNHSLNAFNEQGNLVNNQQLNIESYFVNLITFSRDLERMKEKVNYVNNHQDQIINRVEASNALNTIMSFFIAE